MSFRRQEYDERCDTFAMIRSQIFWIPRSRSYSLRGVWKYLVSWKKKKKKEEEKIEMNFERVYIYSVLFDIELNIFFIYEIEALWSMKLLWKMITWLV